MKVVDIEQGTEHWRNWRRSGIGASDIAAICGACPYRDALDVFRDKMGFDEKPMNKAMMRGVQYEFEARECFNSLTKTAFRPMVVESLANPRFFAALDGYYNGEVLEIKVPGKKVMDEICITNKIPEHYRYQLQWQLYVAEAEWGNFFCYDPDGITFQAREKKDWEMIGQMLIAATNFLDCLDTGIPPKGKKHVEDLTDETSRIQLFMLGRMKDELKELQKKYDELFEQFSKNLKDESVCNDEYVCQRTERQTIDYKQAAEDACVDLQPYKKPKSFSWTIKRKNM